MSAIVIPSKSPLFPLPVAEYPADGQHTFSLRQSTGQCAPFCANDAVPTAGASVAEHGPKCQSDSVPLGTDLVVEDGRPAGLFGSLTAPYLHGVYNGLEWSTAMRQGYIKLDVDFPTTEGGWAEGELFMTAAQARSIAANLQHLADELEQPEAPLRTARARRETQDQAAQA